MLDTEETLTQEKAEVVCLKAEVKEAEITLAQEMTEVERLNTEVKQILQLHQ